MIRPIQTLIRRLARYAGAALAFAALGASFNASALTSQTITFSTIASQSYGTTLTLSATASSGLAVAFSSTTTSVCTVSGNTVSYVATGTCTIAANQSGNATYAAAPQVTQSFSVTNGTQTITFPAIANVSYGVAPFTINATNSINNPLTFNTGTTSVCTVSGSTATIVGTGTCTITASAHPITNYNSGQNVSQSFTVNVASQTITFPALSNITVGSSETATASASSGLQIQYSSLTSSVCSIGGGGQINARAVGTCTIAANQAGNGNFAAAPQVTQSFTVLGDPQTITFNPLSNKAYGSAAFGVSASASSSLAVSFSSGTTGVCTVSGSTVTIVSGGTCSIIANQAGNSTYAAAPAVTQSFSVTPINQTISFAALSGKTYGNAPFTVSATASSGLAVAFSSGTTGVCTVSGNTVTIVAGGSCTINANQAGNTSYNAAPQYSQSFTVNPATQSISFTAPGNSTYNATVGLTASASSGLAVSFSSATTGVCTVSGSTTTMVGIGTCTINANQAGNASYSAASQISHSFTVAQASQTVSFPTISNLAYGSTVPMGATASSGLAVSYSSSTPSVCTVSGSNLTSVNSGTCSVTASQAGNANYTAATPVSQNINVTQVPQSINFTNPGNSSYGATVNLSATATSGLTVAFSSASTGVCTVSGSTATMVALGSCTIYANQAGNAGYTAAPQVSQTFTVGQAAQSISFTTPASTPYGGNVSLSASASSGLAVTFSSATTSICTVAGNTATMVGVGTCTINANQAGNTNYAAAPQSSQSFNAGQATQAISFAPPANTSYGSSVSLSATASSGLTVVFTSATTSVCTVAGNSVTIVIPGTCTINANQSGNADYSAAPQFSQSFSISKAAQSISFTGPANASFGSAVSLSATASSGLTVTFTSATASVCTVAGNSVTTVAAGTCTINADQSGNADYIAATEVSKSFAINQGTQTISFPAPATAVYGASVNLSATSSSGLAVVFASATPAICTVSGNSASIVGVGTCTINANQAGNANYTAATQVSQSFNTTPAVQTIGFTAPGNSTYGATVSLNASATSGLAVTFSSATSGICTVSGNSATMVGVGTCTINANQAGNTNYAAAPQASQSFNAGQASQTISFSAPAIAGYGSSVSLSATASSGLTVAFTSATTNVCTVSGNSVTTVAAGTCTINANQAGNTNYAAAAQVSQSFSITQAAQTITFAAPASAAFGASVSLSATASSGLTVAFTSATTSVCTVSGNSVTTVAAGTCTINANQAGNVNYGAAPQVSQSFSITQAAQTISFTAPATAVFGAPVSLSATASSGLAVSFSSATASVCTVSGNSVTFVTPGVCTINANQAGNANYSAAPQVSQSITIAAIAQTINFTAPAGVLIHVPVDLSATASSGLAVTFSSATPSVCTVTGVIASGIAAGTCTINADQAGNADYAAAVTVSQNLTVTDPGAIWNTSAWTAQSMPDAQAWYPIAYGNGTFVSVAQASELGAYTTNGGATWTEVAMPSWGWNNVVYANGSFFALGNSAAYAISSDGINWIPQNFPLRANWSGLAYGNGLYITVASDGTAAVTSTDGINWKTGTLPSGATWSNIIFAGGKFVAISNGTANVAVSTDGINWTVGTMPASASWSSITFGLGNYVAIAYNSAIAATSPDGLNWTQTSLPQSANWSGVAYGNGLFVAVAGNGQPDTTAATSEDGVNWSNSTLPTQSYWSGVAFGNNEFVAVAGGNRVTNSASFTRTEINPPTVSIVSPTARQGFTAPATINLAASASSSFTGIAQVQYYNGPSLIGSATQAPYTVAWSTAPAGVRSITAIVTDYAGGTTTSAAVPITVANASGTPIGISLSSPSAGQTQPAPAGLTLTANVTDSSGTISRVGFYDGTTFLANVYQAPYTLTIPYVMAGSHSYTAQAVDNQGANAASAAVTFTVVPPSPLSISLINANLGSYTVGSMFGTQQAFPNLSDVSNGALTVDQQGNTYYIGMNRSYVQQIKPDGSFGLYWTGLNMPGNVVTARDGSGLFAATLSGLMHLGFDGSITSVNPNPDFGNLVYGPNGMLYAFHGTSDTVYQINDAGQESVYLPANTVADVRGLAFDGAGNMILASTGSSQLVRVNPDKSTQTVMSISAPIGITAYGQGWLVATAGGAFLVNSEWQVVSQLASTRRDNVAVLSNGIVYMTAYNASGVAQLVPQTNLVQQSGYNAVAMNSPGTLTLAAGTIDSAGTVSQVGFYANGNLIGTTSPGPYTFNWTNIWPGTYSVTAQATDSANNSAASQPIQLTVAGPVITSPSAGQLFQAPAPVVLTATATSVNGSIVSVSYYENGALICSATQSPYTYSWGNAAGGKHTVNAVATDSTGATTASAPVTFTMEAPLSVTLLSPTAGTMTGENFALSAQVNDAGGMVSQVSYYNGASLLGTATQAPYGVVFKDIAAGTYVLTAQVTDGFGRTAASAPVTVTVVANGGGGTGGSSSEVVYDIHTDHLDTPRMITDQSGNIVWQWDNTDPFGNNLPDQNPNGAGSQFQFHLRMSHQYWDVETGTNYNHFRDYDSSIGRYLQGDPIGLLGGGVSTYAFIANNPLQYTDPEGLEIIDHEGDYYYYRTAPARGHHVYPQSQWKTANIPNDVKDEFNRATIKPAGRHGWNKPHAKYNRAVADLFDKFCKSNKIEPSKMSTKNARDFIDEVLKSTNPDIRDFLEAEQGPYIPSGTQAGMTEEQLDELNLRLSEGKPFDEIPGLPGLPEEPPIFEIP